MSDKQYSFVKLGGGIGVALGLTGETSFLFLGVISLALGAVLIYQVSKK